MQSPEALHVQVAQVSQLSPGHFWWVWCAFTLVFGAHIIEGFVALFRWSAKIRCALSFVPRFQLFGVSMGWVYLTINKHGSEVYSKMRFSKLSFESQTAYTRCLQHLQMWTAHNWTKSYMFSPVASSVGFIAWAAAGCQEKVGLTECPQRHLAAPVWSCVPAFLRKRLDRLIKFGHSKILLELHSCCQELALQFLAIAKAAMGFTKCNCAYPGCPQVLGKTSMHRWPGAGALSLSPCGQPSTVLDDSKANGLRCLLGTQRSIPSL